MKHCHRSSFLLAFILSAWTATLTLHAQPAPAKYRGKVLRTEIRQTIVKPSFSCTLVKGTSPLIVLEFRGQDELTHTEVPIYQAMGEIVKEKTPEGLVVAKEFAPIPGETIEGEEAERVEIQLKNPLVNERFTILGKDYLTDDNGRIIDRDQRLLSIFDLMSTRSFDLSIAHATLGTQLLCLSRNLLSRQTPEIPGKDLQPEYDVLEAFGLNFTQQMRCGREGLSVKVSINGEIAAGKNIAIVVEVSNSDAKPVSNLIARSFSRHSWLNSQLFYFGLIETGKTAQFTRYVNIPAGMDTSERIYFSIAFWDIFGAIPEKQQNLTLAGPAL
ncbi:MAG: hypothetical protein GX945_15625 [Lentisphaerae bacterium]|jgi:hypothetical protein|nr:hypothetical protein [Lentisphaerota bacterium]